jgi:hypothetical protein
VVCFGEEIDGLQSPQGADIGAHLKLFVFEEVVKGTARKERDPIPSKIVVVTAQATSLFRPVAHQASEDA